jgi:hypothetical protein
MVARSNDLEIGQKCRLGEWGRAALPRLVILLARGCLATHNGAKCICAQAGC